MIKLLLIIFIINIQLAWSKADCLPQNELEEELLDLSFSELSPRFIELVELGVNPNVCDRYGSTPLSIATFWYQNKMAEYLINYSKVDINYTDQWGWPPILFSLTRGNLTILNSLLKSKRLKFDISIPRNQNIFHISAYNDPSTLDIEASRLILQKATKELLNQKNGRGYTPLHLAIRRNKIEIVKQYLETNLMNLAIQDPSGKSYYDFSVAEGRIEISKLFIP